MSYRYLGNKTRLTDWIVGIIGESLEVGASIADPMCGTAAVSIALARAGYDVTASDALTFPTLHARARLLAKFAPSFESLGGYASALEWMENAKPLRGYFYREFGAEGSPANGRTPRLYFSGENAARIDGIRYNIRSLYEAGEISDLEHSVLLHHLVLAVNSVANISGTYGYFRSQLSGPALRPITFEPQIFENTPGNHTVIQGSVEELAGSFQTDAVYLDPPYTKRQYAGNYHILETIAQEDEPVAAGDGGLRPWADQASSFCYKRSAANAFKQTIAKLRARHVYISYSEDGQVSSEELLMILREFGQVTVYKREHDRFRSNSQVKSGSVLEFLYHLEVVPK